MTDSQGLTGKTVLITGAAHRIGASVARRLHAEGMNVVLHYRGSEKEAHELCRTFNDARRDSAVSAQADLAEIDGFVSLIKTSLQWGSLDLLVNNASVFFPTQIGQVSEGHWDDLMTSNLKAPFFLSQAAAPHLKNGRGSIVNMVDIHARRPLRGHSVYSIAKAGLAMLTYSLARELGPDVRVNGIAPGPILWPTTGLDDTAKQVILDNTALKRAGTPDDIGSAIVYLVRDAAYVTGQIIAVDGGRSIGW